MIKDKKIFSLLSKTVMAGLIVTVVSSTAKAKPAAIDVSAEDNKVYEYQYQALKESALASILYGNDVPVAKLYIDFSQRKKSILAYYDDVRKVYISFDTIRKAAIEAATSDGSIIFDFDSFTENPNNPTTTVTPDKVTSDANGNVIIAADPTPVTPVVPSPSGGGGYVPPPTAVVLSGLVTGATAGNGTITGLTVGKKYVVTKGTNYYGVLADGTLSAAQTDKVTAKGLAEALTGTAITGLINGNTYTVEEEATALTATVTTGSAIGTTAITATPLTNGDSLVYKVSNTMVGTPNLGDTITGTSPLTSGGNINGVDVVNNKYIAVYEVDGNGRVVGFALITLTAANINTPGAAITGLNGVLQLGETTTESAITTEVGAGGWQSNDINVATVEPSTGVVTAVNEGTATISYTTSTSNRVNSQTITVYGAANVVNPTIGIIQVGAGTVTPTGFTAAGTGQTIVWQSSDTNAATVNSTTGEIAAAGVGNTTISYKVTDTATGKIVAKGSKSVSVQPAAVATVTGTLTLSPTNAGSRTSRNIKATYTLGENLTNGTVVFALPVGLSAVVTSDTVKIADGEEIVLTQGQISSDGSTITITDVNANEGNTVVLTLIGKTIPPAESYTFKAKADADGSAVSKTPSAGAGTESAVFTSSLTCVISGRVNLNGISLSPGSTVYAQTNEGRLAIGSLNADGTYRLIVPLQDKTCTVYLAGDISGQSISGSSNSININTENLTDIDININ